MIKYKMFLLLVICLLFSCTIDKKAQLTISFNHDTVSIADTIQAKLYLDNYSDRLPDFRLIIKGDTNRLIFVDSLKSAIFQGVYHSAGLRVFNGYVEYYDTTGVFKKEDFKLSFYVK